MHQFKANPGDMVRVVAPAGRGSNQNLSKIKEYVESLGLTARIAENIYNADEPFYSNFDEFRANDLISAILDNECKVIWCIRGGAGCNRLIQALEDRLPTQPPSFKLLIGYSDITVLHLYLQRKYNWPTIHGVMLEAIVSGSYDSSSATIVSLIDLIFDRLPLVCYPSLIRLDAGPPIDETITGQVTGGNLTLVETSIGTTWEIITDDKILLLEDVSVPAYSLERSLEHMKQVGIFNKVKAVIFGDFTSADSQQLIRFAQERFAKDAAITVPVFLVPVFGHGAVNLPLPFHTEGEIKVLQPEGTYQLCVSA